MRRNRSRAMISAAILFIMMTAAGFNNCSRFRPDRLGETVAGNPVVELSVAGFTPDAGGSSYRVCIKSLDWIYDDGSRVSIPAPISNIVIDKRGSELGSIHLPNGRFNKVEIELDRNCNQRSFRLVNALGFFDSTSVIRMGFTGFVDTNFGVNRIVLQIQNVIDRLNLVANANDISTQAASQNGTFTAEQPGNTLTVEKLFASTGSWNEYLRPDGTACTGTETGSYSSCLHSGELRKVTVRNFSSCANLSMGDIQDAFIWKCAVESGVAVFRSRGFKKERGLRDLIAGLTWKLNRVVLKENGASVAQSAIESWWTNPIVPLPGDPNAQVIVLDSIDDDAGGPDRSYQPGTVFVTNADALANGYNINMDRVALVTLGKSVIKYAGDGRANCARDTGEIANPDNSAVICSGNQKFLWIEAQVDGQSAVASVDLGIKLDRVTQSRVYHSKISKVLGLTDASGFQAETCRALHVSELQIDTINGDALSMWDTTDSWLSDVALLNAGERGLRLNDSHRNTITNITNANNHWSPLFENSSDNVVAGILNASNGTGFRLDLSSSRNTVTHLTSIYTHNLEIWGSSNLNTFSQIVLLRGASLTLENSNQSKFVNLAVDHGELHVLQSSNNRFSGLFLIGAPNCTVTGGTNPGLTAGSCQNQGLSDSIRLDVDTTDSIVGPIMIDDPFNASDNNGSALYNLITDWVNFLSPWRTWGIDAGRSRCQPGQTCRIYDIRLRAADTVLLNRSGTGSAPNEPFVHNGTCPSAIHGNVVTTDQASPSRTYLLNAIEVIGDGVGNENGLCESNEECVYSPNFGAYQGDGDFNARECNFVNGTVSNVKMYAHPGNGF